MINWELFSSITNLNIKVIILKLLNKFPSKKSNYKWRKLISQIV
jgi:uncharacterized protein YggT (Ycf19 family)